MCELCVGHKGSFEVAEEDGWRMIPCPNGCVGWLANTDAQEAGQVEDGYDPQFQDR